MAMKKSTHLRVLTRTPFFAHSTARDAAMCFTAEKKLLEHVPEYEARHIPAFDALYGV